MEFREHFATDRRAWKLHAGDQVIVVGVRADPKPYYRVALPDAQRPVVPGYSNRIDGLGRADPLETQPGMIGILGKPSVGFPCPIFDWLR